GFGLDFGADFGAAGCAAVAACAARAGSSLVGAGSVAACSDAAAEAGFAAVSDGAVSPGALLSVSAVVLVARLLRSISGMTLGPDSSGSSASPRGLKSGQGLSSPCVSPGRGVALALAGSGPARICSRRPLHAGQAVRGARDVDGLRDAAAGGGERHVGVEAGVHCLLRAAGAPLDELATA